MVVAREILISVKSIGADKLTLSREILFTGSLSAPD